VQIGLHNMKRSRQIQALRERRIHGGLQRLVRAKADLCVKPSRERLIVGLYEGHRLCANKVITVKDLATSHSFFTQCAIGRLGPGIIAAFRREVSACGFEQEVET